MNRVFQILFLTAVLLFLFEPLVSGADFSAGILFRVSPSNHSQVLAVSSGKENVILLQDLENGWKKLQVHLQDIELWIPDRSLDQNGKILPDAIFRIAPSEKSEQVFLQRSNGGRSELLPDKQNGWKKVRVSGEVTVYSFFKQDMPESREKKQRFEQDLMIPPIYTSYDGVLIPLEEPVGRATHKLIFSLNQQEYLLAYIIPEKISLDLWEKQNVHLNGRILWEKGRTVPFLIPGQIMPSWK